MGGEIWVDSDLGKGSVFGFYIRVRPCQNSTTRVLAELSVVARGKKVLIVDDNTANRLHLIKITKTWGMSPSVASSVVEAELLLDDSDFALGLIDILMPGQNGDQLAKIIRRRRLGFPIIALSSLDECDVTGVFTGMLNKPINEDRLAALVLNILSSEAPKPSFKIPLRKQLAILSVEDHPTNQLIICRYLKNMGFEEIDTAADGEEAVQACATKNYDLIFMDIKMPTMDGVTAAKLIWEHYATAGFKTVIVALTAQAMEEDEDRYRKEGFDGYIPKPINIESLKNFITDIELK